MTDAEKSAGYWLGEWVTLPSPAPASDDAPNIRGRLIVTEVTADTITVTQESTTRRRR